MQRFTLYLVLRLILPRGFFFVTARCRIWSTTPQASTEPSSKRVSPDNHGSTYDVSAIRGYVRRPLVGGRVSVCLALTVPPRRSRRSRSGSSGLISARNTVSIERTNRRSWCCIVSCFPDHRDLKSTVLLNKSPTTINPKV